MAWTIMGAFSQFREEAVDLHAVSTRDAQTSIYSITSRLESLAEAEPGFPRLGGKPLLYGSFARKTKCQPLDDLDLLVVLDPAGASFEPIRRDAFGFNVCAERGPLEPFTGVFIKDVNSRLVLDAVRKHVKGLRDLEVESVERRLQAVRLKLDFYPWNFDLVPAIPVVKNDVVQHFLIPNGNGDWWRTDPRVDEERLAMAVDKHGRDMLALLRLVKYWNARAKPRFGSYHLETLVTTVMRSEGKMYSSELPALLERCFARLQDAAFQACPDPKKLGPDLDLGVDWLHRTQLAENLSWAAYFASKGVEYEGRGETEDAFGAWRSVFGQVFPPYGSL